MCGNGNTHEEQNKGPITARELCAHIEDNDFWEKHKSPLLVETENGETLVLMQWAKYQECLRELELLKKAAGPGYDPSKECELRITMDGEVYKKLELICFQSRMTVAGAIERFIEWFARHPEDAKKWIETSRAEGHMEPDERFQIKAEWI